LKELFVLAKTKLRVFFIIILLLPILTVWTQAQVNLAGTTISILNVRANPDGSIIGEIGVNVPVQVEGRNRFGNWVLMHSADNTIRGWVATRFIRWQENVAIETIPVTTEVIGGAPAPANPAPIEVSSIPVTTSGEFTGKTISTLNVRSGDGTTNPAIGQIAVNTNIVIEGRNQVGDWFLINATDGSIRGWVASRYVNRDGDNVISDIPVVGAVIAPEAPINVADANAPLSGDEATLAAQLANIPVIPNISGNAVAIYRRGIEQGRDSQHFIQIGDSNSASQAYLGLLGQGNYTLGSYGYLQSTIEFFASGGINSFRDKQQTAQSGNLTTTIVDPIFADPRYCPSTAPIDCEINRTNPSIAIIYLGAADRQTIDHDSYYNAMRSIVDRLVANNVLPILTLMPTKPHPQRTELKGMEFNMIMLEIARQYDIPVINMWAAVRNLPENGMQNDLLHFTYSGNAYLNFAGGENQWGYTRWNLEVLKTLYAIRQAAGV
jgi:uncharacterized protein YraI